MVVYIGADEATTAAVEAGYVPERQRNRVLFLYLSEQRDRYDEADPDGELFYAAYLDVHHSADLSAHGLTWNIIHTARRNWRPDPAARYLKEHPVHKSTNSDRRRGPIGGYSSDYGSGGDYGSSSGWTGGGFHT